jgi:hypothetical protein
MHIAAHPRLQAKALEEHGRTAIAWCPLLRGKSLRDSIIVVHAEPSNAVGTMGQKEVVHSSVSRKPGNANMGLSVGFFPPPGAGRGENGHIISLGADDTLRGHAGS